MKCLLGILTLGISSIGFAAKAFIAGTTNEIAIFMDPQPIIFNTTLAASPDFKITKKGELRALRNGHYQFCITENALNGDYVSHTVRTTVTRNGIPVPVSGTMTTLSSFAGAPLHTNFPVNNVKKGDKFEFFMVVEEDVSSEPVILRLISPSGDFAAILPAFVEIYRT